MKLKRKKPTAPTATLHVGYTRVSTDMQSDEGVSLEAQAKKLTASATMRDVELELFSDAASGKNLDRPAMKRLLDLVKGGKVASVTVYKLDRLTRSVYDLITLIDLLESQGTALVSLTESINTSSATGRLFVQLIGMIAEWERGVIAERTRDALRHMKATGKVYNHLPYGFDRDGDRLVPNEIEHQVALDIIGLVDAGETLRDIAKALNRSGLRAKKGGLWVHTSIQNIVLHRDVYEKGEQNAIIGKPALDAA